MIPYKYFPKESDYFEGRKVFILGYPGSIGSKYWTRGLLRSGIISWLPNSQIENKKFVIDCNVFPGNSGGPVFSFPEPGQIVIGKDTSLFESKFFGIIIQRKFNYNEVYDSKTLKPYQDSTGQKFLAPESIGVAIVEPAKNVYNLLKYVEKILSSND